MKTPFVQVILFISLSLVFVLQAGAVSRDIQFKSIDFDTAVVELHNFGSSTVLLSGWRFCTHDENQVRQYSSPSGLNGKSMVAGESLYLHWNNDAPGGVSNRVNISGLGSFATPLDSGPFGLGLFLSSSFTSGSAMVDHAQWSINGVDNTSADERSDEAEAGGLWVDQSKWISISLNTSQLLLTDASAGALHSPADYLAVPDFSIDAVHVLTNGGLQIGWEIPNHTEVVVLSTTNLLAVFKPTHTNAVISGATLLTDVLYTNSASASSRFFSLQATIGK
ncbi:MAG: hypothetical protein V3V05_08050 [Pontiella sp.]